MKNLKLYVLAISLASASMFALDTLSMGKVDVRGHLSSCYHDTCKKLSNNKGKVGVVVGAVGATIINKVFSHEIDNFVKPFIKGVWKKTCNLFRRIFRKEEKI